MNLCSEEIIGNQIFKDLKSKMKLIVFKIQKDVCKAIQNLEECKNFSLTKWNRPEGGTGIIQYLEDGEVFEKVSICASEVHGILPTPAFLLLKGRNADENVTTKATFFTAGVSGVVYAKNPNIPTLHFSYRYFEMNENNDRTWWFGGGSDLTPYILNEGDCQHFHKALKMVCDKYDESFYSIFKKNCDEYFCLKHRGERRGIGGIFFNDLSSPSEEICFQFVLSCMHNIIPSFIPIVKKNKDMKYTFHDKQWQLLQRGRSVEFSLICDKATKIALMTPGIQYENISIFLPPVAKWQYNYSAGTETKELELLNILRNPREWV